MRYVGSVAAGAAIALLLFLLMHSLISGEKRFLRPDEEGAILDFIRLKKDEIVNLKERVRPDKPPPPKKPPPPPRLKLANQQAPSRELPDIDLPEINLSSSGGGPYLGKWTAGDPASEGDVLPIVMIEPQWPREALMKGIEGYVRVELTILPTGLVKDVEVLESSPGRLFNLSAVRAVLKWKFKPRIVDGQPVESRATTKVVFVLEE